MRWLGKIKCALGFHIWAYNEKWKPSEEFRCCLHCDRRERVDGVYPTIEEKELIDLRHAGGNSMLREFVVTDVQIYDDVLQIPGIPIEGDIHPRVHGLKALKPFAEKSGNTWLVRVRYSVNEEP